MMDKTREIAKIKTQTRRSDKTGQGLSRLRRTKPLVTAASIHGDCGEVVNASDCGSDIRGFDSHQSPQYAGVV